MWITSVIFSVIVYVSEEVSSVHPVVGPITPVLTIGYVIQTLKKGE